MNWTLQSSPELSDQQFEQWSALLEERAGIYLGHQQRIFLQTQVAMRMREIGQEDYSNYYQSVLDGVDGAMEWSVLVDRLAVKETSFYRHPPSIDFVRDQLQERIVNQTLDGFFDLWSVGCSSGEEAYTLAMFVNDCYACAGEEPRFSLTATDISRPALQIAKSGIYPLRKVEPIGNHYRHSYFSPCDDDRLVISHSLRDRVCFQNANVLNITQMPKIKFDVIFCQNVLIYFRQALRHSVMDAFVERLKPGGFLVVGLGEVNTWRHSSVKRVDRENIQAYIMHDE